MGKIENGTKKRKEEWKIERIYKERKQWKKEMHDYIKLEGKRRQKIERKKSKDNIERKKSEDNIERKKYWRNQLKRERKLEREKGQKIGRKKREETKVRREKKL
jgi:hypothetical protein